MKLRPEMGGPGEEGGQRGDDQACRLHMLCPRLSSQK